jgi:iron complex outermembrane receptor protein
MLSFVQSADKERRVDVGTAAALLGFTRLGEKFMDLEYPRRWPAALCGLVSMIGCGAAWGETAPPDQYQLEEVVVTAEFRQERLQTTPIAITAITAATLEARGLENITEVGAYVPNAIIQPLGAGWGATMAAFIRGVGLGDNILSFEPGVPIYVDDVYIGRPQGAMFDLLDLERVEVLRGPQGTLFGKNAIGGTIRMISKKPDGEGGGSMSLTAGNFHRIEARGSTNFTLVDDKVFARLSFSSKKADGWFDVLDYVCVHGPDSLGTGGTGLPPSAALPNGLPPIHLVSAVGPGTGCVADTLNDENVQSGRVALRFVINEASDFNLIGDITSQRQKGPADKYTVIDGNGGGGLNAGWNAAFVAPVYGTGVAWDSRFLTNSMYTNYSSYTDPVSGRTVPNINNLDHWGIAGTYEIKLSDSLNLRSVTAYRRFWNKFGRDSDGSPLPNNFTYDDTRHRQFTEEIQITGKTQQVDWAAGAFYYDAFDSNRGFDSLYPTFIYQNDGYDRQTTRNWAVFGQGTYHFDDKLSFTAGARYTHDEKDATIYRSTFTGVVLIDNAYVPLTASNVDYTLSVDYRWTENFMTYLKYSTGFKGGGFSARPANATQTVPFKPEKLKTAELGAKTEFMDRRVRLNTDVFYSDYIDQQTFAQQLDSLGENWFRYINAGKARIWGAEGELQAEPIDRFRIDSSIGYLNYDLYDNQGNTLLFTGDNCGGRCYSQRTPKLTGALGVQYSIPFVAGSMTPRLDATYQSKIYFAANNVGEQDGYALLNGRLTWASQSKGWEVAAYGRNLTNKEYFAGKLNLVSFFGREQGNPGPPREWGVTFQHNF